MTTTQGSPFEIEALLFFLVKHPVLTQAVCRHLETSTNLASISGDILPVDRHCLGIGGTDMYRAMDYSDEHRAQIRDGVEHVGQRENAKFYAKVTQSRTRTSSRYHYGLSSAMDEAPSNLRGTSQHRVQLLVIRIFQTVWYRSFIYDARIRAPTERDQLSNYTCRTSAHSVRSSNRRRVPRHSAGRLRSSRKVLLER